MPLSTSERSAPVLFHPSFVGIGATLLITGFVTDIFYYETSLWQWANFSAWLIVFGLVVALVAVIFLLIDFLTYRAAAISWSRFIPVAIAALLSLVNAFAHSRDAWTSVVPLGITLSAIVTVLLLIAALRGWRVTTIRAPLAGGRS